MSSALHESLPAAASGPEATNGQIHDADQQGSSDGPSSKEARLVIPANASHSHAKRTLEIHIDETDRRIQEASKLGTALVEQRRQLSERLRDVEQHSNNSEVGPELRQKLADLGKEYNEIGRDSARAFFPKSRHASGDLVDTATIRTAGAEIDSSEASAAQAVSARKQRNQSSNRIHDIEFATEISTSLLGQVRHLQSVLAEKEEALRNANAENARLQADAAQVGQKLKTLDDNEQKFKDENWHLETQVHDLVAQLKEAGTREQRFLANSNATRQEKLAVEREYSELREAHNKLSDEHTTLRKTHDIEVSTMKRHLATNDAERSSLQSRIDELVSQNTDLAKAVSHAVRSETEFQERDETVDEEEHDKEQPSPETSRPSSPTKFAPRHGALESETLKTSIQHAHRMIQNLKSTIHREKTEKFELRRMLQDARDELETRRTEGGAATANGGRKKKANAARDVVKKPPRPNQLGGSKGVHEEISSDPSWEDYDHSPTRRQISKGPALADLSTDSDAFQTANEQDSYTTETDAFHTGAESLPGESSDELTETEASQNIRIRSSTLAASRARARESFVSSASDDLNQYLATPPSNQSQFRRRPYHSGLIGPDSNTGSPASFVSNGSVAAANQNLAAELDDIDGENASVAQSTPGKRLDSRGASPETGTQRAVSIAERDALKGTRKTRMVDAATLTEPWTRTVDTVTNSYEQSSTARLVGGDVFSAGNPAALPTDESQDGVNNNTILDSLTTTANTNASPQSAVDDSVAMTPSPVSMSNFQNLSLSHFSSEQIEPVERTTSRDRAAVVESNSVVLTPEKLTTRNPSVCDSAVPFGISSVSAYARDGETGRTADADSLEAVISKLVPMLDFAGPLYQNGDGGVARTNTGNSREIIEAENQSRANDSFVTEDFDLQNDAERSVPLDNVKGYENQSLPFRSISGNARSGPRVSTPAEDDIEDSQQRRFLKSEDSQVSSEAVPSHSIPAEGNSISTGSRPFDAENDKDLPKVLATAAKPGETYQESPSQRSPKRPSSSGSSRRGTSTPPTQPRPPLPADHRELIAAASRNSSLLGLATPPAASTTGSRAASYQFRPRTPNEMNQPQASAKLALPARSRASPSYARGDVSSPGTRRSSVSSFASEIEERFNTNKSAYPLMDGFEMNHADPRMIQAITQTMIGEFLWKYTRKAGRGDHSENRHQRFFWIHPYTRTLYWSNHDPSRAGRQELKAKSVAIEAVRVVTDENPIPPGIHQKSIVIVTPGRSIKFTAPTSQRHETWFNALSYLLLRVEPEPAGGQVPHFLSGSASARSRSNKLDRSNTMSSLNSEDLSEFNPALYDHSQSRLTSNSRGSVSSPLTVKRASASDRAQALAASQGRAPVPISLAGKRSQAGQKPQYVAAGPSTKARNSAVDLRQDQFEANKREVDGQSFSAQFKKPAQPASLTAQSTRSSVSKFGSLSSKFRPSSGLGLMSLRGRNRAGEASSDVDSSSLTGLEDRGIVNAEEHSSLRASEEDARLVHRHDHSGAMENVRACCDGKHDVGSLAHQGRPGSITSRQSFLP